MSANTEHFSIKFRTNASAVPLPYSFMHAVPAYGHTLTHHPASQPSFMPQALYQTCRTYLFFFCFFSIFFRAKDMVDVFKSHLQDAYSSLIGPFGNSENITSDERFTATASNRVAIEKRRKRLVNEETEKQVCADRFVYNCAMQYVLM